MTSQSLKWLLFPGLNLHARLRNRILPPEFLQSPAGAEPKNVLDAGCGNGMLAYRSYLRGNKVLGISIKPGEIERNQQLFHAYLRIPEDRLRFRHVNLYDVQSLDEQFDEIICTEVLEHIAQDERVCRAFFEILKPGGALHLCCPNADHPDHKRQPLDDAEEGGHVRAGYTEDSYRRLLEPIGFDLSLVQGLGGAIRQSCNKPITRAQEAAGVVPGLALFVLLGPWALLDPSTPRMPYSLYVKAKKANV